MTALGHDQTIAAIKANDPPIAPHQVWAVRNPDGENNQFVRILARHPDDQAHTATAGDGRPSPRWIYETTHRLPADIGVVPEYNLRRLFTLDQSEPAGPSPDDLLVASARVLHVIADPAHGTDGADPWLVGSTFDDDLGRELVDRIVDLLCREGLVERFHRQALAPATTRLRPIPHEEDDEC